MTVVDHEPSQWFLVKDGERLLFDVNCSHGALSYEFLMELNASEREGYTVRGHQFLSDLAEKIQDSAPGALGSVSPYRERALLESDRGQVNEATVAWIKGRGSAT
jgi:hypothetical protein